MKSPGVHALTINDNDHNNVSDKASTSNINDSNVCAVKDNENEKNEIMGVCLDKYKPIESFNYYGQYLVSQTGAHNFTPPLPGHIADYLRSLQSDSDISLWDGTQGTYGRDYISHRPPSSSTTSQNEITTDEQIESLRSKYLTLIADTTPRAVLERLRKSLDKQTQTQHRLEESMNDVRRKVERLKKQKYKLEIEHGSSAYERINDIDDRLVYDNEELVSLERIQKQMKQKILQIELELNERETGHVRRMGLLRKIFGEEPLRGGLLINYCDEAVEKADEIYVCDIEAMITSKLLFQCKCFYLDCVNGKEYLYKMETNLKGMLENLQQIMNVYNDNDLKSNSTIITPSMGKIKQVGSSLFTSMKSSDGSLFKISRTMSTESNERDFRLKYVRKLWNTIDSDFKQVLKYIDNTSLPIASAMYVHDSVSIEDEKQQQFPFHHHHQSCCGIFVNNGTNNTSIINSSGNILPRFTTVELSYALNKRAKIAALHRYAAKVYKQINFVYDTHDSVIQQTLTLLQKRMQLDRKANERLICKWEELLGVSSQ